MEVRKEPSVFRDAGMRRLEGWREPGDPRTGSPTAQGVQTLGAVSVLRTAPQSHPYILVACAERRNPGFL